MKKSKVFVQPVHPYRKEILVIVGSTFADVKKVLGKKDPIYDYLEKSPLFDDVKSGKNTGIAIHGPNSEMVLILPEYKDNWAYWENLIHELSHIVDYVQVDCLLTNEVEATAYLHEWLFRRIRQKIQGIKN